MTDGLGLGRSAGSHHIQNLSRLLAQVVSAFEVPKILYDPTRKCFYKAEASPKLHGSAQVWTRNAAACQ